MMTIKQVSQQLNVPTPTIRSWERRYGIVLTSRSSGGHRRYSSADVAVLCRLRDDIAAGRRPIDAAAGIRAAHPASPEALVETFLESAHRFQPDAIVQLLDTSLQALSLERTFDEVLFPALREVGRQWETGGCDVAHEHLATEAVRAWLGTVVGTSSAVRPARPILLSCGPRDQHTLGLECLGALLRRRGIDCRILGARTPAESLARAVHETDPAAVVVVGHLVSARRFAVEALRSAQRREVALFYAGNAFVSRRARLVVPGTYLGTNVAQAAELVTATISSANEVSGSAR